MTSITDRPTHSTDGLTSHDISGFADGVDPLSPDSRGVATDIDRTLRSTGFLLVTGHGVEPAVRSAYFDAMREFFALPLDAKDAIAIDRSEYHRGYVGMETESLEGALGNDDDAIGEATAADLKETLDTGIEYSLDHPEVVAGTPFHGPNQWPDLPGFRDTVEAYRTAVTAAARRVQRALAVALDLDSEFFLDQPGETMYHLRLVHYPPMERVTPEPGQLGCGAHTDYGTVTLLADDGIGGLQVRQRSGEWIDVQVPDDALIVNLGDLMAIWTNDRWVSNPHRVVNPAGVDRYSSPLFVTPPYHLRIETLPTCLGPGETPTHEPLVSGPYLQGRFDGTHAYRNELLD
ncbi:MAG: 2-oxoglutarate and iron-dependent oxygenase domain-containing protein [Actinomycetota bacterium]